MTFSIDKYLTKYKSLLASDFLDLIKNFQGKKNTMDLLFQIETSAVYSSNIEGNTLNVNSFMNQKQQEKKFHSKEVKEIENLVEAYQLAQKQKLTELHFLAAHKLSAQTLLPKNSLGKYRDQPVGVFGREGLIYMAIEPENVKQAMAEFFEMINKLLAQDLDPIECFYYASFLHLRFVHIHPFADGNGRMARLLEKWFLCEKLDSKFWSLPSEQFYWDNRSVYYPKLIFW